MSLLLKNLSVQDINSPFHNKKADILIENGLITSLQGGSAEEEIEMEGMQVTCGWFDLSANFNDPGDEYKEDLNSGTNVALRGGFTDVSLTPDTNPIIETKSDVHYIRGQSSSDVDLHVIASVSKQLEGVDLTEIMDLHHAGAVAFSSGDQPIWNAELLMKALQYTDSLNIPIIQNARDLDLSRNTHMHEGLVSTTLGLRGEPSISEELVIQRDIEILKYSGGAIHFSKLSSSKSVELIRNAKREGLTVTCDVGIHHLLFTDESVGLFNTNYKSLPPFRSEIDRLALIDGLNDGTIDAICSNHRPQDQESKELEFDLADSGTISLQTFYPCLLKISKEVSFERLLDKLVNGPLRVLKKKTRSLEVGNEAKLTILEPDKKWILNNDSNISKSINSPFWEEELIGKVYGTVNGDKLITR